METHILYQILILLSPVYVAFSRPPSARSRPSSRLRGSPWKWTNGSTGAIGKLRSVTPTLFSPAPLSHSISGRNWIVSLPSVTVATGSTALLHCLVFSSKPGKPVVKWRRVNGTVALDRDHRVNVTIQRVKLQSDFPRGFIHISILTLFHANPTDSATYECFLDTPSLDEAATDASIPNRVALEVTKSFRDSESGSMPAWFYVIMVVLVMTLTFVVFCCCLSIIGQRAALCWKPVRIAQLWKEATRDGTNVTFPSGQPGGRSILHWRSVRDLTEFSAPRVGSPSVPYRRSFSAIAQPSQSADFCVLLQRSFSQSTDASKLLPHDHMDDLVAPPTSLATLYETPSVVPALGLRVRQSRLFDFSDSVKSSPDDEPIPFFTAYHNSVRHPTSLLTSSISPPATRSSHVVTPTSLSSPPSTSFRLSSSIPGTCSFAGRIGRFGLYILPNAHVSSTPSPSDYSPV